MKSKSSAPGFLFLLLILAFGLIPVKTYSQDETARGPADQKNGIFKMPAASLKQTVNDTVLPTLCNSGTGLIHFELTYPIKMMNCHINFIQDCRNPMALRANSYTEEEWNNLMEQKRLMEEQFLIEWQKQVKKVKMDLQLGEIIKGFYMQPPF